MPAIAQEHTSNSNTPNALHHPQPTLAAHLTTDTRCQHRYANQKRCRLNTQRLDARFCLHHLKFYQPSEVAVALTANLAELKSPQALNDFLSRLLLLLAQNKISPRRAAVLGYITNQLLRTIHAIDQKAQQAKRDEENAEVQVNVDIGRPTWNPLHDLPEDDPLPSPVGHPQNCHPERSEGSAFSSAVNATPTTPPACPDAGTAAADPPADDPMPSPVGHPQNCHPERSEGSAFSSAVNATPTAPPACPDAGKDDDPPPATHPKNIPLPRWGEPDPVTKYTYREPERRSTYGPPRMSTRRRTRRHARDWNGRDCNGFVTQNCSPVYAGFLCWETATRFCIWRGVRRNLFANP